MQYDDLFRFLLTFLICVIAHPELAAEDPHVVVSLAGDQRVDLYNVGDDGQLVRKWQADIAGQPGASCFDRTGRRLYVATSTPDTISLFETRADSLHLLQSVRVPSKPSYLTMTPSGQFLIASYFKTGQVTVHRIVSEGHLSTEPLQTLTVPERAHGVAIDRSGDFVFVPHTRPNVITQFRLDATTGKLSPNIPPRMQRQGKIGPRHLWFHPTANFAYGSNEQGRSISQYGFDPKAGTLMHLQTISSMPAGFDGKGTTSHVEGHPTGEFVYIANRGHGSLAAFAINQSSGALTHLQTVTSHSVLRSFSISPGGRWLIAAGQKSGQLTNFKIRKNGRLLNVANIDVGQTPWWVTFSPVDLTSKTTVKANLLADDRSLALGQGTMAGEVSDSSVLMQTRLTLGRELDAYGDLPGGPGVACFEWSTRDSFGQSSRTPVQTATAEQDFIVRAKLSSLQPDTQYFYRVHYGRDASNLTSGPTCQFRTLPGRHGQRPVKFIVGSCMNYVKFMHGRKGNAHGPLTATNADKRQGFPAFASMSRLHPDFFVGTGDIVYYDNPFRVASTTEELRRCWHEQFRFPRMIDFFKQVPTYWSKDDHDFRYNDSDNESARRPLPKAGIDMFHEQLPIAETDDPRPRSYRTIRVSHDLQIWLTEGRDFRSPNKSPDGPQKTMWGEAQRNWLQSTLASSDAKWKILINPTPMVGPDDGYKQDNHANLKGFRHEADAFFEWATECQIDNLFLVCGDRHWQYHSIHPSGVNEFACGALNDENARMGVPPGAKYGSDPEGKIRQPYTSPEPSGGFVQIEVAAEALSVTFFTDDLRKLHKVQFP